LNAYDANMKREHSPLLDAVFYDDASIEKVRRAFQQLNEAISHSQAETLRKQKKLEQDMKRGARATKHRFRL